MMETNSPVPDPFVSAPVAWRWKFAFFVLLTLGWLFYPKVEEFWRKPPVQTQKVLWKPHVHKPSPCPSVQVIARNKAETMEQLRRLKLWMEWTEKRLTALEKNNG
jgi:hypothetical protein